MSRRQLWKKSSISLFHLKENVNATHELQTRNNIYINENNHSLRDRSSIQVKLKSLVLFRVYITYVIAL